jgi:altronate hydrolase
MSQVTFASAALRLHPSDNVAVLKKPLRQGDELLPQDPSDSRQPLSVPIRENIPAGHKVATQDIAAKEPVRKYGQIIGFATCDIAAGSHVHTQNVSIQEFQRQKTVETGAAVFEHYPAEQMRTFMGFARPDGQVGTRNYIGVVSSVNCSASVSNHVRDHFRTEPFRRDFPNMDGVVAFTHKTGCGMDAGEPREALQRVLTGMARHPNIAGFVMIGLGCEVNHLDSIRQLDSWRKRADQGEPAFLNIQNAGGVRKTVEVGIQAVMRLLPAANAQRRTPQPISHLVLAENCGGSDAHSGITANPALGFAADELVRYGGTVVLAETPEIYGAEHLLTRRAVRPEVAEQLLERIRWWEDHVRRHQSAMDNNPSPGNKAGGLTNIIEKSLGAVAKAGQSPLAAVYKYAEPIREKGLCFMDTPGFDPVSMTGLVAGGCNVGVFTTGRGSVYGCKPTPCIKVATTTALFKAMEEDMDLNAGSILDGTETVADVGGRILEKVIAAAGGEKTKSELAGIGDEEFAPWQLGPTL